VGAQSPVGSGWCGLIGRTLWRGILAIHAMCRRQGFALPPL